MLAKSCSRSQGHPVSGVRKAAMSCRRRDIPDMGKGTGRSFGHLSPSARALSIRLAARLEQEPATLLRLVYEDFEETRSRGIFMIFRKLVRIAHILDLAFVVVHQLQQHVTRAHEIRIIVLDALKLCDVTDGADGGAAHFAHALG